MSTFDSFTPTSNSSNQELEYSISSSNHSHSIFSPSSFTASTTSKNKTTSNTIVDNTSSNISFDPSTFTTSKKSNNIDSYKVTSTVEKNNISFNPDQYKESTLPNNDIYVFDDNHNKILVDDDSYKFRYSNINLNQVMYDMSRFTPIYEFDRVLQTKILTPSKTDVDVIPDDGFFGLKKVTVKSIPDIYADISGVTAIPENVSVGKYFVDRSGNLLEGTLSTVMGENIVLNIDIPSYTYPSGLYGNSHTVSINLQEKEVTPIFTKQTVVSDINKVLKQVIVDSIPITKTINTAGGYTVKVG